MDISLLVKRLRNLETLDSEPIFRYYGLARGTSGFPKLWTGILLCLDGNQYNQPTSLPLLLLVPFPVFCCKVLLEHRKVRDYNMMEMGMVYWKPRFISHKIYNLSLGARLRKLSSIVG